MNKKSFLRGFGAGVLFVTVILGISCLIRTSDSAVITRAKKMGMTFASSSNNTIYDNTKTASGSSILGNEKNTKNNSDTESTPVPTSNAPDKNKKDKTFEEEKKKMEKSIKEEKKKLTISSGDWAKKVADNLEDEGIISDSGKFVDYMKENDYANKIRPGEYEFSIDDDFSDIAKTITKQK